MASVQINTEAEQESSGAVGGGSRGWGGVGWEGERVREASHPHRGKEGRKRRSPVAELGMHDARCGAQAAAPRYLIVLRGPRVEGPPQEELGDHAAQGPHVDGLAERQAKDDLRSSAQERKENITLVKLLYLK